MKERGFTLIEMVITVAISAILLGVGIPGFQSLINNNRLSAQASDLVVDLALARSEAVKRGTKVSMCTSTDGTSCTTSSWSAGRVIFTDGGTAGTVDGTDRILRVSGAMDGGLTMASTSSVAKYIQYAATGGVAADGTLTLCKKGFKGRTIRIAKTGRVSSQQSSATCS